MALNSALVGIESRGFLAAPAPRDDKPALGPVEVFGAKLRNRQRASVRGFTLCRVITARHVGEGKAAPLAGLLRREHTVAANRQATAAAVPVAILEHE
jgi:hypothetical protein